MLNQLKQYSTVGCYMTTVTLLPPFLSIALSFFSLSPCTHIHSPAHTHSLHFIAAIPYLYYIILCVWWTKTMSANRRTDNDNIPMDKVHIFHLLYTNIMHSFAWCRSIANANALTLSEQRPCLLERCCGRCRCCCRSMILFYGVWMRC